jgi:uncharacterized protein (DUF1778 family)
VYRRNGVETKSETLILRIGAKEKQLIAEAAGRSGESMTTLVRRAALNEAKKILTKKGGKKMEQATERHTGVPRFFKYGCLEASQGGTNTYATPAWHLAIHLDEQIPYDADEDEWANEIDKLQNLCAKEDEDAIWQWFTDHYPKCMELVPDRRKDQFVKGILRAYEDDRIQY